MLAQNCPLPAVLTSVPETECPVDFGQVAKIAFQIVQDVPSFTEATIKLKATWTPLLAAVDETKIVLTPILSDLKIPKTEVLTEGGNDNTTLNGMPFVKGLGNSSVTAILRSISDATKQALQALHPHSQIMPGQTNLWAYFLTSDDKVICKANGTGIEVTSLAISDLGSEGFAKPNEADMKFFLPGGWSDGVKVIKTTDIKTLFIKNPA